MNKTLLLYLLLFSFFTVKAQDQIRFNPDTIRTIYIDSAVNIRAHKLNVEDFIHAVVTDTSFYSAFQNMKRYSFLAENQIYTYDKHNKITGNMYRKLRHTTGSDKIQYLAKVDKGNLLKKNGKYQLLTVEMFDYIFGNAYAADFVPDAPIADAKGINSNAGIKDKLKTLIFNPGRPITGVPFISNKTQIFSANMRQYYDYTFYKGKYLDSIPVFWFKVKVKPDISNWTKDGLMIKELTTIFDARNFAILGRNVDMKLNNILFDFDVKMNIEMSYFDDVKLPVKISYQGNWNVPFKKEERASFLVSHRDYKLK